MLIVNKKSIFEYFLIIFHTCLLLYFAFRIMHNLSNELYNSSQFILFILFSVIGFGHFNGIRSIYILTIFLVIIFFIFYIVFDVFPNFFIYKYESGVFNIQYSILFLLFMVVWIILEIYVYILKFK